MSEFFSGLLPETDEQKAEWQAELVGMPVCAGREVEEKLFAEPPDFVRVENQGQTNTCAANSGTSCLEKLAYLKTGQPIQLSRNYLYLRGQQECGIRGDSGCTLGGILKAMKRYGVCPEELWPFNQTYQTRVPQGCDEAASEYKALTTIDVETSGYNGFRTVLGQNIGAVEMACSWPLSLSQGYIVERYQPQGSGGHAIAALFLSDRKDDEGRPYVWVMNSHSEQAQRGGWLLWSPTALDELCERDSWGNFGVSDMQVPEPREFDWVLNSPFKRR